MIRTLTLGATLLAAPVAAQTPDCDAGRWIGGGADASDVATMEAPAEQMALVLAGERHATRFRLGAPAETRIEAQGRGNGDPVMTLYDSAGAEIASDDDSGGNGAARIERALEPGDYCAVIRSYDDGPMTAFVRVGRTAMEPLTAGAEAETDAASADMGGCEAAADLGTPTGEAPLATEVTPERESPVAFTLTEPTAMSITAENEAADPTLGLSDETGRLLDENDDFDGLNARLDVASPLPPGRYCVTVGALGDAGLPIVLRLSVYDPQEAVQALYDRGDAAPPIDGSYPVTDLGALSGLHREDIAATERTRWLSFEVPQAGALIVEALAVGPSGDPWLVLYDAAGRQLALNDDTAESTDALLAARVAAGRYMVGVKQVAGASGYIRLLLEAFVPAP